MSEVYKKQVGKSDVFTKESLIRLLDKIQTLSNTLVNAHEQLKDKNNKIKTLTENNETLNLRIKALNDTIKKRK